jgi:hypothetical protein
MWLGESKVPGNHMHLGCITTGPGVSENLIFKFLGCAALVGSFYRLITFVTNVGWAQQHEHCKICRTKQRAFTYTFVATQQGVSENLIFKILGCAALVGSLKRLITFDINVAWGQQNEHCGSCRAKQQAFTCAFVAMQQGILENLIFKFLDCAALVSSLYRLHLFFLSLLYPV